VDETYVESEAMKIDRLRTSLIVDPPNGMLPPLLPAALARIAARPKRTFEDPEIFSLSERCLLGSFGLFFTMFCLFVRFFPMVATAEVKTVLPQADPHWPPGPEREIKDHPVAGVGFGGYWIAITRYHRASGETTPPLANSSR
jgi:hypothetical protein